MARHRPHKANATKPGRPPSVGTMADELLALLQADVSALRTATAKLTATQRGNQIRRCVATAKELQKLSGDELTEKQVLRAPALRRVLEEMKGALERHPAALAEVVAALERVAAGVAA